MALKASLFPEYNYASQFVAPLPEILQVLSLVVVGD